MFDAHKKILDNKIKRWEGKLHDVYMVGNTTFVVEVLNKEECIYFLNFPIAFFVKSLKISRPLIFALSINR